MFSMRAYFVNHKRSPFSELVRVMHFIVIFCGHLRGLSIEEPRQLLVFMANKPWKWVMRIVIHWLISWQNRNEMENIEGKRAWKFERYHMCISLFEICLCFLLLKSLYLVKHFMANVYLFYPHFDTSYYNS